MKQPPSGHGPQSTSRPQLSVSLPHLPSHVTDWGCDVQPHVVGRAATAACLDARARVFTVHLATAVVLHHAALAVTGHGRGYGGANTRSAINLITAVVRHGTAAAAAGHLPVLGCATAKIGCAAAAARLDARAGVATVDLATAAVSDQAASAIARRREVGRRADGIITTLAAVDLASAIVRRHAAQPSTRQRLRLRRAAASTSAIRWPA